MNDKKLHQRNVCDLQTVLSSVPGRRVLYRILQAAQIDQHGFVPGDPSSTAFHCGQKSIGLFLLAALEEASPGICGRLRAEYLAELKEEQEELNRRQQEEMNDD